jgi:hypothetical protein
MKNRKFTFTVTGISRKQAELIYDIILLVINALDKYGSATCYLLREEGEK